MCHGGIAVFVVDFVTDAVADAVLAPVADVVEIGVVDN